MKKPHVSVVHIQQSRVGTGQVVSSRKSYIVVAFLRMDNSTLDDVEERRILELIQSYQRQGGCVFVVVVAKVVEGVEGSCH